MTKRSDDDREAERLADMRMLQTLYSMAAEGGLLARADEIDAAERAQWAALRSLMTKRELEAALADACKMRDQWCAEYVKVRDELANARSGASRLRSRPASASPPASRRPDSR